MSRINDTFQRLRAEGRTALMPYLTIGYPEQASADRLVPALVEAGADLIELGVPFSDPLADGTTIQASTQRALQNGVTLRFCLETVRRLRARGIETPFLLMGYYNPIYQMGIEPFARAAREVGADGVIVPDLPPEEAEGLDDAMRREGLSYIYMLAPTSDEARLRLVAGRASGFIYLVSLTGVTGERVVLPEALPPFVGQVRVATGGAVPLAVGFGINTPEAARAVGQLADGVIIGTALIKRVATPATAEDEARRFVAALRAGLDTP